MAELEVGLVELLAVREALIEQLATSLTAEERCFLLSFKKCAPEWPLLGLQGVEHLPAIKWKLHNLQRMDKKKHAAAIAGLEALLGVGE